jgi:hypothetical protein
LIAEALGNEAAARAVATTEESLKSIVEEVSLGIFK